MSIQKIFVAGHGGMVGSALVRLLKRKKKKLILKSRKELDLTRQQEVEKFFFKEKPDQVYIAAAKVGGIYSNSINPTEFLYENLMIQNNIIYSAFISGVKKILFLGSSCIYPKFSKQPIKEEYLLTGSLESTNESYAIAKIAGIKLIESLNHQYGLKKRIDYRSIMPTNLYGPGDNYDLNNSHVIPALIKKFHEAKIFKKKNVVVWGTGKPKREFLYVDDFAQACYFIMNLNKKKFRNFLVQDCSHVNVGFGKDISINELAKLVKSVVGFNGKILFDNNKPDGMPKKLLDSSKIFNLGWKPKIKLKNGLKKTYVEFVKIIK